MAITPLMPVYPRCGVRPVRGEGGLPRWRAAASSYLDFAAGIAVNALGHGHPHADQGDRRAGARRLMHVSNLYGSPQGEALAQRLVDNSFADTVFFTNSRRRGGRVRDQDRAPLSLCQRQPAAA